ncbi:MAG: STAS domain-containing protein [Actinomycetota bacterium]
MAAELTITPGSDGSTFVVTGELDTHTAPQLTEALSSVAAGSAVTVDLAGTSFMSSAGLSALLNGQRRLSESGGGLTVSAASAAVERLFELSGVAEQFGLS